MNVPAFTPLSGQGGLPPSLVANPQLATWIDIDERAPGVVVIRSGKVELGQGILTALRRIAAHELRLEAAQVRMAPARTGESPNESITSNSLSIQHSGMAVGLVCRQVRHAYAALVARREEVDAARVTTQGGVFYVDDRACGTYWSLRRHVTLEVPVEVHAAAPEHGRLSGPGEVNLALRDLVAGAPVFLHDKPLEGGLHGRILRPPSIGARLLSLDTPSIALPGRCRMVRDGSLVGVLAEAEHEACKAVEMLRARAVWQEAPCLPQQHELDAWLRAHPSETRTQEKTSAAARAQGEVRTFVADYFKPFLKHASIGPSCAYARVDASGELRVWTHSQGIYNLRADLAVAFGMAPEAVVVEHVPGSGCYGQNGADDAVYDAAWLAKRVPGKLVRVQWSRADELNWSPQSPAMSVHVEADVDAAGRIVDWRQTAWSPGHSLRPGRAATPTLLGSWYLASPFPALAAINAPAAAGGGTERNIAPLYDFPCSALVSHRLDRIPIRTSSMRSLGAFANVFAIESLVDDVALSLGRDPVEFRLGMLSDARAVDTINAAVSMAQRVPSRPAQSAEGAVGRGLAFARYKNKSAYCAVVADVEASHTVRVRQLFLAADVGEVINPIGAIQQLEGGAIQATSWATLEEARFDRQRLLDETWEDYPILRFSQTPEVAVDLVPREDEPPLGLGEASLGPTAAAIGNALRNALGVRVRRLPITFESIANAIQTLD